MVEKFISAITLNYLKVKLFKYMLKIVYSVLHNPIMGLTLNTIVFMMQNQPKEVCSCPKLWKKSSKIVNNAITADLPFIQILSESFRFFFPEIE